MAASSYSEALLTKVRDGMTRRGLNRAALAKRLGMDRRLLRSVLAGQEPLTVDTFFAMVEALGLGPADLGIPAELAALAGAEEPGDAAPPASQEAGTVPSEGGMPQLAVTDEEPEDVGLVDPDGPQAAEILRVGFALGIDMHLFCDAKQLRYSGVPEAVLARFPDVLPIKLDAAYHHANRAQYLDEGLQLRLSFDRVRTCIFPWACIQQVTLYPEPPLEQAPVEEPEPTPEPGGRPALRLVTS